MPLMPTPIIEPYGWRCRFGLLQPTTVTDNNPYEFYLMAPLGVQLVLTSLGIEVPGPEAYERALAGIEAPIRRLLARNVDVIVQAGVPPIVERGWGAEDELRARVAQWTDLPFASDIGCSIAALHALGVHRLVVLANPDLERGLREYLAHADIEVLEGPEELAPDRAPVDPLAPGTAYRAARALGRSVSEADGLFIPIASRPTVGMIGTLEADIGVPVITSAQAMMWQGLRLAGVGTHEVVGFGRLFEVED